MQKHSASVAAAWALLLVLFVAREASAQTLVLAQGGGGMKGVLGYALTLLCILLGLVVVLRPNKRKLSEKKKQAPAPRG